MAYCVTIPKPISNPMRTSDLVRLCGTYMGVMSQRLPKDCIMSFKINFKLLPQVPETNGLKKLISFSDTFVTFLHSGSINRHKTIKRTSQSTQHMLCGRDKPSGTSIICDYHQDFVYASMFMVIPVNRHRQHIALHARIKLECNKKSNTLISWNQSSSLMTEAESTWITPTVLKTKCSYTLNREYRVVKNWYWRL